MYIILKTYSNITIVAFFGSLNIKCVVFICFILQHIVVNILISLLKLV